MPALADVRDQAVTGVVAPATGEAVVRDFWATVTISPAAAVTAKALFRTVIGAPIAAIVLAPHFVRTMFLRYRLTNRRLMVLSGLAMKPSQEVPLDQIADARIVPESVDHFYLSGTIEVLDANGKVLLTLPAVSEPESARRSILQAVESWGPFLKPE